MREMRAWRWLAAVVVFGALMAGAAAAEAQETRPLTVADLVDIRELDDVRLSPNGRWVAATIREVPDTADGEARGERGLWVVPSDGSAAPRRVAPSLGSADSPTWTPAGTLSFLARGAHDRQQVYVYDPDSPEAAPTAVTAVDAAISSIAWSPTGGELAYLSRVEAPEGSASSSSTGVWLLDVATGASRPLTAAGVNVRNLTWSPDGDALALIASGEEGGTVIRVVERNGGLRTIAERAGGPGTRRQMLDWSPDGSTVLFARDAPDGRVGQLIGLAPVDGGPVRELLADYEGIVMRAFWDPSGRGIIGQSFEGLLSRLLRIDPETGEVTRLADIMEAYPTVTVSDDGRTFAYRGERLEGPADVWVLRDGENPRRITHLNPRFDSIELGTVRPFRWSSPEDGTALEGVLVLPPDYREGETYPTIVQLHGGPHFHWALQWLGSWHDWAHLLATNGYVVFHPNPRGSTGRGIEFASAIIHDIGGIDYRDVMTGVDALVDAGIADEDRLGVGGWSYGGFLTARTITQTTRFKAAVVGAGISNLFSFAGQPGLGRGWANSFFSDHPYADRAAFEDRSATTHLGHVRTPTLVVHGERDAKISVGQAWELHNGLRYLGVDTEIVVYPQAGHGLTSREDRMDYLTRVLGWYDRHLQPGAGGVAASDEGGAL